MNSTQLIGRVTKDIELKYTSSNKEYVKFTLAVKRDFKTNGEYETDWISCITWSKSAIFMSNYVKKGHQIAINGRIQTGSYNDKEGRTVYTTDVVAENVQSLEKKQSNEPNFVNEEAKEVYERVHRNTPSIDVSEDDLPF